MSRRFITFRYFEADSVLHRSSPIVKGIWLLLVIVEAVLFSNFLLSILSLTLIVLLSFSLGRVRLRHLKPLWPMIVFAVAITIILMFTVPSTITFGIAYMEFAGFKLSFQGFIQGFIVGSRMITILIAAIVYSCTTNPRDIMRSLTKVRIPYRIAHTGSMGITLLPVFDDMADKIRIALKIRGFGLHGGITERVRSWKKFAFLILAGALTRAEKMGIALDNRGFGAYKDRTYLTERTFDSRGGLLLCTIWLGLIATSVALSLANLF
jgi:energy-coupling factor transport system permease protein